MSIDDLTKMDLTPIIVIFAIVGALFLLVYNMSVSSAKSEYKSIEEKTENNLRVVSKDLGDLINIGGTIAAPIKGYRCTFVFERQDGSRLVLKTSKAEVYESIVVGDVGDVKYKGAVLIGFNF